MYLYQNFVRGLDFLNMLSRNKGPGNFIELMILLGFPSDFQVA